MHSCTKLDGRFTFNISACLKNLMLQMFQCSRLRAFGFPEDVRFKIRGRLSPKSRSSVNELVVYENVVGICSTQIVSRDGFGSYSLLKLKFRVNMV